MTKIEKFVSDQWYDFSCYGEPGRITPREAEADLHELSLDEEASKLVPKGITPSEYARIWNRLTAHNGFKCGPQPRNKVAAVYSKLDNEITTAIMNIETAMATWATWANDEKVSWSDVANAEYVLEQLREIERFAESVWKGDTTP